MSGLTREQGPGTNSPDGSDGEGRPIDPDRLFRLAKAKGIPLGTILATVGVLVVVYLSGKVLYRIRDVVMVLLVAGLLALLLNPLVAGLQRWRIRRRGLAVAFVVLGAFVVFVGLAVIFGYYLVSGGIHLAHSLPSYIANAEHDKGWVGHLVRRFHLQTWAQTNQGKLSSLAKGLGKPAVALGKGAASVIVAVGTTLALVVLLLLEGPKMRKAVLSMLSPPQAKRCTRVGTQIGQTVTGYIVGDTITSIIAGVVVFVTLSALSVPYPALWAGWVAFVDYLPSIGGALAGIPTVLFALGHSLTAGIVTLVVFVAYQQVENHLLNPLIMGKTVKVNPLFAAVAVLFAAEVGNWVGGVFAGFAAIMLAVPTAGALQVIAKDLWSSRGPNREGESGGHVVPFHQQQADHESTH